MAVEVLTADVAGAAAADALGVPSAPLDSREALAAAMRRAASFLCPASPSRLIANVERAVAPFVASDVALRHELVDLLQALTAYGDLVETEEATDGTRRRLVYLGAPRYVPRSSGDAIVLGVRPEGAPIVGDALADKLIAEGHIRRLPASDGLQALLDDYALRPIAPQRWLRAPAPTDAEALVRRYDNRLAAEAPAGEIPDLHVMDTGSTGYYRGRWRVAASTDDGRYVGRRGQAYGADLWCYVEISKGQPIRFVDLPAFREGRGCDEAWRLQAALDAHRGGPQSVAVSGSGRGSIVLGLHIPPPKWLQRRWDLLGVPVRQKGSLFAYEFSPAEAPEELEFARKMLWLERLVEQRRDGA